MTNVQHKNCFWAASSSGVEMGSVVPSCKSLFARHSLRVATKSSSYKPYPRADRSHRFWSQWLCVMWLRLSYRQQGIWNFSLLALHLSWAQSTSDVWCENMLQYVNVFDYLILKRDCNIVNMRPRSTVIRRFTYIQKANMSKVDNVI